MNLTDTLCCILALLFIHAPIAEAKKLVKAGGFYINNVKVTDVTYKLSEQDWIDGAVCVLRSGKSNYKLVRSHST